MLYILDQLVQPFDLLILPCYIVIMINKKKHGRRYKNPYHSRAYLSIGNNSISMTRLEFRSVKINKGMSGFIIVHISDLHNKMFGENQCRLLNRIKEERPDIIVITGDVIDRRRTDIETAMSFFQGSLKIAPVYYVSGNHEIKSEKYMELRRQLKHSGVVVLNNDSVIINKGGGEFRLAGLNDASSFCRDPNNVDESAIEMISDTLKGLISSDSSRLNVLLTHRPELIDIYQNCGADLVLSGHAHGGQVRLPFIGGLFAPGQGILPKYTSGMYTLGNTSLIVSRGLGNSKFPLRIFNPPEVAVVTLINKKPLRL